MNLKKVPVGNDDFRDLITGNYYYVDKTLVIEELLERGNKVVLYPRPRRFGKSLFISMLDNFFDIDKRKENEHLFDGLAIQKSEYYKEFGEYPVITLDFKNLKQDSYESVYNQFVFKIQEVYKQKEYILEILDEDETLKFKKIKSGNANEDEYKNSIYQLSNWLERYYHKKTIILVDEYDIPIQEGYLNGFYKDVIELIRSVLSSSLKGNDSLKMGVMTGILRVSKESIFSDLNNPKIYDMMSPSYNEAFGFTESETKELLKYYGLELTSDVKAMYDGYNFMGTFIYNPWSVLNYAEDHILQPYWMNTSGNVLIKKMLGEISEKDKLKIEQLIINKNDNISIGYDNRTTYQDFEEIADINKTLNLLFASGYLTLDRIEGEGNFFLADVYVKIPNEEVRHELLKMIQSITYKKELLELADYKQFLYSFERNNKSEIEEYMNDLLGSMSYHDEKEMFYHGYTLGLLGGFIFLGYDVKLNRETGKGRCDILVKKNDKTFGCIIEFKIADKEEDMESLAIIALNQMKEKEYYKELELDKVQNIKEYAVVFCGKKCIVR